MEKRLLAITGAPGAGKSRLTYHLRDRFDVAVPRHTTTRQPRADDELGFYNYISLEEFTLAGENDEFLFHSGDGVRHYGVSRIHAEKAWEVNE